MSRREAQVPTKIMAEYSNTIVRNLVYEYSDFVGAGGGATSFQLQITDPDNPLFLFDFEMDLRDFAKLRDEQKLLCEFGLFPRTLAGLLQECTDDDNYRAVLNQDSPDGPVLLLQQITKFSLITHLKLILVRADDERLKEYLSGRVKFFKAAYEKSQEEIAELHESMAGEADTRKKDKDDFARLFENERKSHQEEIDALTEKAEARIAKQKQDSDQLITTLTESFDRKEKSLVAKYEQQIGDLRKTLTEVLSLKDHLTVETERQQERISGLESQLGDTKILTESIESEKQGLLSTQTSLSQKNSSLQTELATVTAKYEALKEALEQKSKLVATHGNSVDALRDVITQKDCEIMEMQRQIAELSKKAQERDWLAEKSKTVINKLQADLRKVVQHHNEQKATWDKKMEEMKEVQLEIVRLTENIKALELAMKNEQAKSQDMHDKNETLKAHISQLQKAEEENKQLVTYLENQLNKAGVFDTSDTAASTGSSFNRLNSPRKGDPLSEYAPQYFQEASSFFESPTFY